jgi:hypothetical protein
MISFSDSIPNDSSIRENENVEELFSDFSILTSTSIPNANNKRGKQTLFFVLHLSQSVTLFRMNKLIQTLDSRSSSTSSLLFF